jgi:G:T-mismatch repair DNA endonuclease (very short patch repair protein)
MRKKRKEFLLKKIGKNLKRRKRMKLSISDLSKYRVRGREGGAQF